MSTDRFATLAGVYILLTLVCDGTMVLSSMPFWIWDAAGRARDVAEIAFTIALYLLVYSTFFVYPYAALRSMYPASKDAAVLVALWAMATIMLFHNEIAGAISRLSEGFEGGGTLWQWLLVLWLGFTFLAVIAWQQMVQAKYKAKFGAERISGQ
jgi:hypothetical protein